MRVVNFWADFARLTDGKTISITSTFAHGSPLDDGVHNRVSMWQ
jgi:hypothetical protein